MALLKSLMASLSCFKKLFAFLGYNKRQEIEGPISTGFIQIAFAFDLNDLLLLLGYYSKDILQGFTQ